MAPRSVLLALAVLRAASATITNPSFEESGGWTSLSVFPLKIEDGEAWAPPHGTRFATLGCDDAVTDWMERNGYTCESYETSIGLVGKCGDDDVWVAAAACRQTCWDAGKAYASDNCDAAGGAVEPVPSPRPTPEPPAPSPRPTEEPRGAAPEATPKPSPAPSPRPTGVVDVSPRPTPDDGGGDGGDGGSDDTEDMLPIFYGVGGALILIILSCILYLGGCCTCRKSRGGGGGYGGGGHASRSRDAVSLWDAEDDGDQGHYASSRRDTYRDTYPETEMASFDSPTKNFV